MFLFQKNHKENFTILFAFKISRKMHELLFNALIIMLSSLILVA